MMTSNAYDKFGVVPTVEAAVLPRSNGLIINFGVK